MCAWEAEVKQNLKWYSLPLLQGIQYLPKEWKHAIQKASKSKLQKEQGGEYQFQQLKISSNV